MVDVVETGLPRFSAEAASNRNAVLTPVSLAGLTGLVVTALVLGAPPVRFAYDNLLLHVSLETAEGLVAALLSFLAWQRFRGAGASVRDLILAWAFGLLALTNLIVSALPLMAQEQRAVGAGTWAAVTCRLVACGGLAAAAFVRPGTGAQGRRVARAFWWSMASVAILVILVSLGADRWLADAVDPTLAPEASTRPRAGHPAVLSIQLVGMVLGAAAAWGFTRQSRAAPRDELLPWLAAGAALFAFARLHFFLFPSLYSNWVYTGDLLRLASYACFLVGAARQIAAYRHDRTRLAILDDRRRLARDLHDGLIQELSFIHSQLDGAPKSLQPLMADHLAHAARRALDESRRVVEVLADGDHGGPLGPALLEAAQPVAARAGASTELSHNGCEAVRVRRDVREALTWIVREAVGNAVRHGASSSVRIALTEHGDTLAVEITDDGTGFDGEGRAGGFGLRSMRERAEGVGGSLDIASSGAGTQVTVRVPRAHAR